MKHDIPTLKTLLNSDFRAEVLFYEFQHILDNEVEILARFNGISKRNSSKDIIDISTHIYQELSGYTKEALVLHISKNSIYHNLPELLFHPLSISNSTMSNKEIVNEIRKNKSIENQTLNFFLPFDNELFHFNKNLTTRSLHLFNDKNELFLQIINELISIDFPLTPNQLQNLFLYLSKVERLKENLPEIEEIIKTITGNETKIRYIKHRINDSPFLVLGDATLGYTLGLSGSFESEIDDLEVCLFFNGDVDFEQVQEKIDLTKKILEYLIVGARKIEVVFFNNYQLGIKLNENYLGINTLI